MMMLKVCLESNIPGLVEEKRENTNYRFYAIFNHENSKQDFTADAKNEKTPVN